MRRRFAALAMLGATLSIADGGVGAGMASAQSPTLSLGLEIVPADGAAPGSGVGVVLGLVGSKSPGTWESLVRASIASQATVAAATVVDCGDRLPRFPEGECRGDDEAALPDVLIDLRRAARADEPCPPRATPLLVVDRADAHCGPTLVGPDERAAGELLGRAVATAMAAGDRCAVDRLYLLKAEAGAVGAPDVRLAGLIDGFMAVCGTTTPDRSSDVAGDPSTLRERLRAAFTTIPGDGRAVVLAADDAAGLVALAAARDAGRSRSVRIGAVGGSQPAWPAIACDPAWVADVALQPEGHGRTIVPVAIALADGASVAPFVATPMRLIDANEIRSVYPDVPGC